MSAKHTPTPWKAGRDDMQSYECSEAMLPVTHIYAATVFEKKKHLGHNLPLTVARAQGDNNKADAAFIVEACNQHAQLVAQNERLRAAIRKALIELGGIGVESSKEFHRIGINSVGEILDAAVSLSQPEKQS